MMQCHVETQLIVREKFFVDATRCTKNNKKKLGKNEEKLLE